MPSENDVGSDQSKESGWERESRERQERDRDAPAPVPTVEAIATLREMYGPGKSRNHAVEMLLAALADREAESAQLAKERDALRGERDKETTENERLHDELVDAELRPSGMLKTEIEMRFPGLQVVSREEMAALHRQIEGHAERIAAQSNLLANAARKESESGAFRLLQTLVEAEEKPIDGIPEAFLRELMPARTYLRETEELGKALAEMKQNRVQSTQGNELPRIALDERGHVLPESVGALCERLILAEREMCAETANSYRGVMADTICDAILARTATAAELLAE